MRKLIRITLFCLILSLFFFGCKPKADVQEQSDVSLYSADLINTIFLLDLSGSMNELTDISATRLETSTAAISNMLDMIIAEQSNPSNPGESLSALVTFAYEGNIVAPLTDQTDVLKFAMQELTADGGTNLADGLQKSLQLFEDSPDGKKQIILLSDGLPTFSSTIEALTGQNISQADKDTHAQDLQNEVLAFTNSLDEMDVCLYLIAFDPSAGSDANPEFLQQFADSLNCGHFYQADDVSQLYAAFLSIWHTAQGEVADQHNGQLALQDDATTWSFEVPAKKSELVFSLAATESGLSTFLIDPKDQTIDADDEGVFIKESVNGHYISVRDPLKGKWQVYVTKESEGHTPVLFNTIVTTRVVEKSRSGFPLWLGLLIFIGVVIIALGILFYLTGKKDLDLPWKKIFIITGIVVAAVILTTLIVISTSRPGDAEEAEIALSKETKKDASPADPGTSLQTLQASVAQTYTPQVTQGPIIPGEPWGKIVFTCQVDREFDHDQICIINADGTGLKQLTTELHIKNTYPNLSEDGQTILFASNREGDYNIFEMKTDGTSIKQITTDIGECYAPDVSPDGKKIVFERRYNNKTYIATMDRDGSNLVNINDYLNARNPIWSPDGKEILFTAMPAKKFQIYRMNADGTNPRRITALDGIFGQVDWAENGMMVSFRGSRDAHNRELFLFNEGIEGYNITEGGDNITPSYSPDGEWIAFMSYRDNFWHEDGCEIYIMRLEDQKTIRLTENFYCDYQPQWGK